MFAPCSTPSDEQPELSKKQLRKIEDVRIERLIASGWQPPERPKGAKLTRQDKKRIKKEQEWVRLIKAYKRRKEIERWPKVRGYGHISPHCGRLLPKQVEASQLYNTGLVTWPVAGGAGRRIRTMVAAKTGAALVLPRVRCAAEVSVVAAAIIGTRLPRERGAALHGILVPGGAASDLVRLCDALAGPSRR